MGCNGEGDEDAEAIAMMEGAEVLTRGVDVEGDAMMGGGGIGRGIGDGGRGCSNGRGYRGGGSCSDGGRCNGERVQRCSGGKICNSERVCSCEIRCRGGRKCNREGGAEAEEVAVVEMDAELKEGAELE